MLNGRADGVGNDDEAQRLTHSRIRDLAAATPTVYLPTHDPDSAARLAARARARTTARA
jgi:N-acyl homoserine lactone hydrolase